MVISIQDNKFLSEQDFDRAIEYYTTATDIEEDEGVLVCCYSNQANAYYEKGLYTDCITNAKDGLKICDDPKLVKKGAKRGKSDELIKSIPLSLFWNWRTIDL